MIEKKKKGANYNKLTCGLVHLHFVYPLFKTYLFVHLCFNSFAPRYPSQLYFFAKRKGGWRGDHL